MGWTVLVALPYDLRMGGKGQGSQPCSDLKPAGLGVVAREAVASLAYSILYNGQLSKTWGISRGPKLDFDWTVGVI